jgi:hypothetical protein
MALRIVDAQGYGYVVPQGRLKVVKPKVRATSNSIRWWNSLRLKVKAKTP